MPCRAVDAVLPAEFLGAQSRLVLLQDADDLFLGESAAFHVRLFVVTDST